MKYPLFLFLEKTPLFLIRLYQKTVSPDHGILSYRYSTGFCKFSPTCSQYAYEAIEGLGLIKGGIKAVRRIFRCHPLSRGGYDPVDFYLK